MDLFFTTTLTGRHCHFLFCIWSTEAQRGQVTWFKVTELVKWQNWDLNSVIMHLSTMLYCILLTREKARKEWDKSNSKYRVALLGLGEKHHFFMLRALQGILKVLSLRSAWYLNSVQHTFIESYQQDIAIWGRLWKKEHLSKIKCRIYLYLPCLSVPRTLYDF